MPPEKVVLHPLVLLSVVDHYNRVAKDTKKRVVGVLLGEVYKGTVDVTNSFALPFEEDDHDPSIWFLDHSYLEQMYKMFKKVNGREKCTSSGSKETQGGKRALPNPWGVKPTPFCAQQLGRRLWAGTARAQSCGRRISTSTSSYASSVTAQCWSSARCR